MIIFKFYGKYYIVNDIVAAFILAYLIKYIYNILNSIYSIYRKRLCSKNNVAENCENKDNSLKIRGGDLKLLQSLFDKIPDRGVCLVQDKSIISTIRHIFDKHYARKV